MTNGTSVTTVLVSVVPHGNYLIANSRDIPGLHVWGESEEQLCERVVHAIKTLYKANKGIDVQVFPRSDPDEFPALPDRACSSFVIAAQRDRPAVT